MHTMKTETGYDEKQGENMAASVLEIFVFCFLLHLKQHSNFLEAGF